MTVNTRKSTAIGNRDSVPTVATGASISGGMVREYEGYVDATNGDSANSYYPICSVPSNMRISSIVLQNAALGSGAEVNVGVFVPTQSNPALLALNSSYVGGAAIDATLFASAQAVSSANGPTEIINQSGNNLINDQEMELWQAAGLASDPGCNLDIGIQVAVAIAATGYIGLKVKGVM